MWLSFRHIDSDFAYMIHTNVQIRTATLCLEGNSGPFGSLAMSYLKKNILKFANSFQFLRPRPMTVFKITIIITII